MGHEKTPASTRPAALALLSVLQVIASACASSTIDARFSGEKKSSTRTCRG
jgi:hypothetical protein